MCENWKKSIEIIYASLELKRKIVGVKFIQSKTEFENTDAIMPKNPMNYCGMIKSATCGYKVKLNEKLIACKSGVKVLGINSLDVENSNGENWTRLGLYKDKKISKYVRENLAYKNDKIYGIIAQPIETFEEKPDIIIIVTNPYNIMRLVQGYSYHYGIAKNINFVGNQAICLECTARPFVVKDLNISALCIGTRHRAGWLNDELAAGIPFDQFENIADGILKTINIMESNENKKKIKEKMKYYNIEDFDVKYNYNYYNNV